MMNIYRALVVLGLFAIGSTAQAFPEMVRYGHLSCLTCHISPTGGGIVTPYGRELSADILSMWGTEFEDSKNPTSSATDNAEAVKSAGSLEVTDREIQEPNDFDFMHGLVTLPEWLNIGGDIRGLRVTRKTKDSEVTRTILMQTDLEVAVSLDRMDLVAALGRMEDAKTKEASFVTRRHYLSIRPSEDLIIRVGKFFPAYGIQVADHAIVTKRNIGFDIGLESYNLELTYIRDFYEMNFDLIFGRPYQEDLDREEGFSFKTTFFLNGKHSAGFSMFQGKTSIGARHLFGFFGMFGFTRQIALISEVDFQLYVPDTPGSSKFNGHVMYHKLSYEVIRGLNINLIGQQSHLDAAIPSLLNNHYGIGLQAFPIAHLEFQLEYQKSRDPFVDGGDLYDTYWMNSHYYF